MWRPRATPPGPSARASSVPGVTSGYPRWQAAPPVSPQIERQKAARDHRVPRSSVAVDPGERRVYRLRPRAAATGLSSRLAEQLDPDQRAAVEALGTRTLVVAAAGSGKTRTIVGAIAHLVEGGTPPAQIALMTFTRRAAREMVWRAQQMAGADLSDMTAGTFHSVCQRLLRRHGQAIGLPAPFTVLDGEDQADLAAIARDHVLGERARRPSLPRPAALVGLIQQAAESDRPLAEVVSERNGRLVDRLEEIDEIASEYVRRKRALAALDYADLLVEGRRLLREAGPRARGDIRWAVVDELHDVNAIQAEIAELLAGDGGLFAVGDPDQAIYAWRGADVGVVDRFAEAPDTTVVRLERNYRSTPEVVELAQRMLPGGNRYGRHLRSTRPAGGPRPVVAHMADTRDEAAFVTQRIADLINEGRAAGDIAVLYRAHHHSVDLQLALAEAGVEFELHSGARFVESAHVKDALAVCRVRHNLRDDLAWLRLLRLLPGVGEATAASTLDRLAGSGSLAEAAERIGAPGGRALSRAAEVVSGLEDLVRPEDLVISVARSEWYVDRLRRRFPNWQDREADLARLAELAARSEDLDGFLAEMQLAERVEADEDVSGPARRVALSSVHQAKGLEWPVVFVLQVESGSFPSGWAVSEGSLDEEERLFYVALTRAADEIYLCRPIAARRPWDTGANAIALNSGQGFLDVDLDGLVEEWSVR